MSKFLKQVARKLTVSECDGNATLARAGDVFTGYVDDFKALGLDQASGQTRATEVAVYEMTKNATFKQMFGSLSNNTAKLCLTQAQIIEFVKTHSQHLRKCGYSTFFLFKVGKKFFVAYVRLLDVGLSVSVCRFENNIQWYCAYRHRVVVPQL